MGATAMRVLRERRASVCTTSLLLQTTDYRLLLQPITTAYYYSLLLQPITIDYYDRLLRVHGLMQWEAGMYIWRRNIHRRRDVYVHTCTRT